MTVYVDDAVHPFGRMLMCHMWADTEEELLAMADTIGVARKWIQGHPTLSFGKHRSASWVHFDIAKGKRALAIQHGAVLTDMYGPVYHTNELILKDPNASMEQKTRAAMKIAAIERVRANELET